MDKDKVLFRDVARLASRPTSSFPFLLKKCLYPTLVPPKRTTRISSLILLSSERTVVLSLWQGGWGHV